MVTTARFQTECLIPGCLRFAQAKLLTKGIAICTKHGVQVWNTIDEINGVPIAEVRDKRTATARDLTKKGDIYIARVNGLIKIGWSGRLYDRLRSYGPGIDVLCHYPGTEQDEKNLHHRFRPFLANGREWFNEHQMITDHVAAMVKLHGRPQVIPDWTKPTDKPIKPRYWRGAA